MRIRLILRFVPRFGVLLLLTLVLTLGCASKEPAIGLANQILENQRVIAEQQRRDLEALGRLSTTLPARLEMECTLRAEAWVDLRVVRVAQTKAELRQDFEKKAWQLQWEDLQRAIDRDIGPMDTATRRAVARTKELDQELRRTPNDVYLKTQRAEALAETAANRLASRNLKLDRLYRLAEKLEVLRKSVDDRIDAEFRPIEDRLGRLREDPCVSLASTLSPSIAERRASFEGLHEVQIEGIVMLRDFINHPGIPILPMQGAAPSVEDRREHFLPESSVQPLFEKALEALDTRIREKAGEVAAFIDTEVRRVSGSAH